MTASTSESSALGSNHSTLRLLGIGLAIGVADLVPGVSGGTIAFVSGIYADLLAAIRAFGPGLFRDLLRGRIRVALARIPWSFLLPLLAGITLAILTLARVFRWALAEHQAIVFAFFAGLVLASVIAVGGTIAWRSSRLVATLAGAGAGLAVITLVPLVMPHDAFTLFWTGAAALTAWLLPGISGAFVLLILGQYEFLLGAVATWQLGPLLVAAAGGVTGLALFAPFLTWLLRTRRDATVALLLGFMGGSLPRLWPFGAQTTPGEAVILVLAAGLGFTALTLLDHWRTRANPLVRMVGRGMGLGG